MDVVLATTNRHKIEEMAALLVGSGLNLVLLDGFPVLDAPVEDAEDFAGNARIKALAYARHTGLPALADDSGICVDALGGAPGVFSARWAGEGSRADAWITKTLTLLQGVPSDQRGARYVCAFCLADPEGRILAESHGVFEGRIAEVADGDGGFGYDPIFLVAPDFSRTAAQLTAEEKNAISHRGVAARELVRRFPSPSSPSN